MKVKMLLRVVLTALLACPALAGLNARADEGMWPFNNVPRAEIKRRYGFDVTDEWLRKLQLASVAFPGGSGSVVSPEGLVLTNHHIASDSLQKLSTPERDLMKNGFLARTRTEELPVPGLELRILQSYEEVTDRVNAAVKPDMSAADAAAARQRVISSIESESQQATPGLSSSVVTFYQGGQYHLYRYKTYKDVRLVFAPETAIAFFGGDPDNFMYPRYNLDMSLFRLYEDGRPARTDNYLRWSKAGAKAGELVFVTGHPGTTQRLNTVAHLEFLRSTQLPLQIKAFDRRRATLQRYGTLGAEQERRALDDLLTIENSLKVYKGQVAGLNDPAFFARKQKAEAALVQTVSSDPRRRSAFGDAWEAIGKGRKSLGAYERERRILGGATLGDTGLAFHTPLFGYARALVRLAEESAKPNAERLPEYTDARRSALEGYLYSTAPIYDDYEQFKLADSLAFARDELGASHPLVRQILDRKTPEARAAELIKGTRLKDVEYRRQLAAGGRDAVKDSKDPLVVLARELDDEARKLRKRYDAEVVGVERGAYAKIARALFDTEGTRLYPDATSTLRLSFGAVKGYQENGRTIPPFTDFAGLYQRSAQHGNRKPWELPPRWTERRNRLNLRTPFNLVSTNDIIGGNSGSPLINKDAEVVGLIFDGNIQSIVGSFVYDDTQNRSVSVDSRGMIEAMRKIYDADTLADELTGVTAATSTRTTTRPRRRR
ncbi:MAG TPA: S46 family peptidase [Pyrinomonadaceae bacterium]|nr:S46 family peptidase [Pyrinomonadaceae bacterium]